MKQNETVYVTYHVFSECKDEFFADLSEAEEIFNEWIKKHGCGRVHEETRLSDGELINTKTIRSFGPYPR